MLSGSGDELSKAGEGWLGEKWMLELRFVDSLLCAPESIMTMIEAVLISPL